MTQFSSSTFGRYAGFWLIVTAAIELALAVVFIAIGLFVPIVDWGMFLTAAILGATGIVLLVIGLRVRSSAAANAALLQSGMPGTALVTGVSQTGMYLNENPQVAMDLRVDLPGREPYLATRKEFVPLILLGRLTSGVPLPVRVDRANPQRLVIDWSNVGLASAAPAMTGMPGSTTVDLRGMGADPQAIAAAIGAAISGAAAAASPTAAESGPALISAASAAIPAPSAGTPAGIPVTLPAGVLNMGTASPLVAEQFAQMRAWLRQTGIPATARIDQAMDMGTSVGSDRLFTVQATLEIAGKGPEKLQPVAALVASDDVEKVREGYRVSVRVAPDNHQLIDFDW
jgi:hypothetical protein